MDSGLGLDHDEIKPVSAAGYPQLGFLPAWDDDTNVVAGQTACPTRASVGDVAEHAHQPAATS
jgi:hypothetical protein